MAVGACALVVYLVTAAPGVLWGDSAKLALLAMDFELSPLPSGHPGYVMVGGALLRLFPGVDPAALLNHFSALCGAGTVAVTALMGARIAGGRAGVLAGLGLAVAHLHWFSATMTESYAPAAFLMVLAFDQGFRAAEKESLRRMAVMGFCVGLGASINPIVALMSPGLAWVVRSGSGSVRRRHLAVALGAAVVGASPYLVAATVGGGGSGLVPVGGGIGTEFVRYTRLGPGTLAEVAKLPLYLVYQFPGILLPAVPVGVWLLFRRRRSVAVALLLAWAIDLVFVVIWLPQRQFLILGAGLFVPALFGGVGADHLLRTLVPDSQRRGFRGGRGTFAVALVLVTAVPVGVYLAAPGVAGEAVAELAPIRSLPGRGPAYFLQPWKGAYGAPGDFARAAEAAVPPDATVVADFTLHRVLAYSWRGEEDAPDLVEVDGFIHRNDGPGFRAWVDSVTQAGGSVYLADVEPAYYFSELLLDRYRLVPVGPVWHLRR